VITVGPTSWPRRRCVLATCDRSSLRNGHGPIENGVRCGRALNRPLNDRPVGLKHPCEVSRIRAAQPALRGRIDVEVRATV
jgi:hypothetical protein